MLKKFVTRMRKINKTRKRRKHDKKGTLLIVLYFLWYVTADSIAYLKKRACVSDSFSEG
jgi:hypothetical protein